MNPIVDMHSPVRRQSGAASIAIVLVIMLILTAAVISMMKVSGSSVIDAAKNEEQVAALFLAESGMERAQAVVSARAKAGTLASTDTTAIVGAINPTALGRGSFQLTATFVPSGCGPGACNSVTIDSVGTIAGTSTKRALRSVIATQVVNNTNGCENTLTLTMPVINHNQTAAVGALTHLAFRPKESAGPCISASPSNAEVKDCSTTPGGTCDFTTNAWAVEGTGTNAISSMAAFATALYDPNPLANNTYKIETHLWKKNAMLLNRSFVQLGVLFYPKTLTEPVDFVGRYAKAGDTEKVTGLTGTVPDTWTCQPSNTTTSGEMWRAATADLLYYGFASWPDLPTTPQLNGVTLGIQPLRQTSKATGAYEVSPGVIDGVYSQVWTSYNPPYFPSTANPPTDLNHQVVTGASTGANFMGETGGVVVGSIPAGSFTLTVASVTSGGLPLRKGDTIVGTNIPANTTITSMGSSLGGAGNYTVSNAPLVEVSLGTSITASSTILRVSALPVTGAGGVMQPGDTITTSALPITGATIQTFLTLSESPTFGTGFGTATASDYRLSGSATRMVSTPNIQSSGKTVTVPITSITALPVAGTAVAVSSGAATGAFPSVSIAAGTIATGSLTATGSTLCIGDALFGRQILANTKVTGYTDEVPLGSGSGCGTGPFAVSGTTTASTDLILARTAVTGTGVVTTPATNSFTVSRQPSTRLNPGGTAVVCGGICAMLFNLNGTLGPVSGGGNSTFSLTLSGFPSGDDWASGLACLRNVDSAKIQLFGTVVAKQTNWAEVVR